MATSNSYGLNPSSRGKKTGYKWFYLVFMVLLALFAMSYVTQTVAHVFAYDKLLGNPLFHWGNTPCYYPWAVLIWFQKWPHYYYQFDKIVTIGQAIFLVPQFIILGSWFARRRMDGNKDLHGSAHWATREEIQNMRFLGIHSPYAVYIGGWIEELSSGQLIQRYCKWLGLVALCPIILLFTLLTSKKAYARQYLTRPEPIIHHYLKHDGPEHLMAFAPTRSGKGVGLIIPTLLAWLGSSLVLDIKGENWGFTSGWLKSLGHYVMRFDPADSSGSAARFNPLEEIELDKLESIKQVQNIALMLVDPEGKGLSDHWNKAAFGFFAGMILHCCVMTPHEKKRPATLNDLVLMMSNEGQTAEELLEEMLETDHTEILKGLYSRTTVGSHAHTFIASSAREMLNKDEKESSGVLSTALVNLALYRDPIVAMNTSRSDFKLNDLMNADNPLNLYLVSSPSDIDRLKPLLRLMVDMIVRRVCEKMEFMDGETKANYKYKLLFMLDELTSLGKLPILEKAIAYIAGYGGKMFLIVQDVVQLNKEYGKDNALLSNCHIRIAYAPNNVDTASLLSKMTGKTTVVDKKTSLSGSRLGAMKNASISISETARPLLTEDECMRIPGIRKVDGEVVPGDMLIFSAGSSPIYGKQILFFKDPTFRQRVRIPVPGICEEFPAGISDSLYWPMSLKAAPVEKQKISITPTEEIEEFSATDLESYF